jgi:hypothetical protein
MMLLDPFRNKPFHIGTASTRAFSALVFCPCPKSLNIPQYIFRMRVSQREKAVETNTSMPVSLQSQNPGNALSLHLGVGNCPPNATGPENIQPCYTTKSRPGFHQKLCSPSSLKDGRSLIKDRRL